MRADFRLGSWTVRPRHDCISRGDEIVHVHPRPMAVLECLAAARGEVVTRKELFETVWPGVFVTDDALTQCIVELRRVFGDSAHDAQIIQTIPKVGFCLIPTVQYLTESQSLSGNPPGQIIPKRETVILITAALLLLVAVVFWYLDTSRNSASPTPLASTPSIAVLPFADMSQGGDQEYFADGLTDELLNRLARMQGLLVTSRTSSFHFKGKNEDLQVIAETLGVSYLLEGSVRKDGEHLRINAQLLDAATGFHLWSETYDREPQGIFAIQDEISTAIAEALRKALGLQFEAPPRIAPTKNFEAHDAYLRGRFLVLQRTPATIEIAIREFETAISLDPDFALAHAGLAIAFMLQRRSYYGSGLTYTDAHELAAPHAERALALDPTLVEALYAKAIVMEARGDLVAARELYRQAIQINPNYSLAYTSLANSISTNLGRYDEAFALRETALRVDPLSVSANGNYFGALLNRDLLADAERFVEKFATTDRPRYLRLQGRLRSKGGQWANRLLGELEASRMDLGSWTPNSTSARYLAFLGLEEEALTVLLQRQRGSSQVCRLLGRSDDAVTAAKALLATDPMREHAQRHLALALAAAGEYERARPLLETAWQRNNGIVTRSMVFSAYMAAALIAVRRAAGAEDTVGELVAALRDNVRRYREAGITGTAPNFEAGLADFLSGERESGLALIAKAAEDGYFILPNEAYLQTLYEDPGFAPILAGQKARQARERKRFLDVVCNDKRYADVWQPAAGTCKRFATEDGI